MSNHNKSSFIILGTASGGFTILFMKIKLEWHSIVFCNLGSLAGLIVGKISFKLLQLKMVLLARKPWYV